MIRAVVFDLDGTLVDSLGDIAAAVNSTLVRSGRVPHAAEAYRAMVGWGLKRTIATAAEPLPFSEPELEGALAEVLEAYGARPVVHTSAYEGIPLLLESLRGKVFLGVLSNKDERMTKTIVENLFHGVFGEVRGARPDRPPKPDPAVLLEILAGWGIEPDQCAFVGDSGVDMRTALGAGCVACGAVWGYRDEVELRSAGATDTFADAGAFGRWLLDKEARRIETEGGVSHDQ